MEEIIRVSCDDEELNIKIEGDNIDLYIAIAEIIEEISVQRGVTTDTSIRMIREMTKEEPVHWI